MKATISRILVCVLFATLAAGLATGVRADDVKWDDKQFQHGVKEMAKAYKELHQSHVAYITGYHKNASQQFDKALKHYTEAQVHFAKAEVPKSEAKTIDKIVNHLDEGNKALAEFVKDIDKGKTKDADQNLDKAIEQYSKVMDLM
jgi:hypothetical protein